MRFGTINIYVVNNFLETLQKHENKLILTVSWKTSVNSGATSAGSSEIIYRENESYKHTLVGLLKAHVSASVRGNLCVRNQYKQRNIWSCHYLLNLSYK